MMYQKIIRFITTRLRSWRRNSKSETWSSTGVISTSTSPQKPLSISIIRTHFDQIISALTGAQMYDCSTITTTGRGIKTLGWLFQTNRTPQLLLQLQQESQSFATS